MAGIYVHIPFCRTRCIYCSFYSTILLNLRQRYVDAVCRELAMRKDYLRGENVETIYFGGGTPSQLEPSELEAIFKIINENYSHIDWKKMETTMECNPDDVTPDYAREIARLPINRVSMGIQTFDDSRLQFLKRRHTSQVARNAVSQLRKQGIKNISIDLMFGFPEQTLEEWENDVREAIGLGTEHISAYSLTIEEGTPLEKRIRSGEIAEADEETCRSMYYRMADMLTAAGYDHYEISNFAKPGFRSRHNSRYWHDVAYLGVGAAAHSYDRSSRQWNISDIREYIEKIERGIIPSEKEILDSRTRYNDLITTALRTAEGIDTSRLSDHHKTFLLNSAKNHIAHGRLALDGSHLHLTRAGLYVSDDIMSDLIEL